MMEKADQRAFGTTSAPSRRQIITMSLFAFGGLAIARSQAQETSSDSAKRKAIVMAKAIHDEVDFHAIPQRIYDVLLDAREFKAFSGGRSAEIHREVGGAFSIFGGLIVGWNLELIPAHRIVQAWRAVSWPEGIYSIARFELQSEGSGTRLIFDHTGFPVDQAEHLESGWQDHYWKALRSYVG
jgi:activator of HSP90 ATPase